MIQIKFQEYITHLMIILFLISFNMNSLLVFYGAFVFYFFSYNYLCLDQNFYFLALSNFDLVLLPFVFWFLIRKVSTPLGYYKNYNKIILDFNRIQKSYKTLAVDLFLPLTKSISAMLC